MFAPWKVEPQYRKFGYVLVILLVSGFIVLTVLHIVNEVRAKDDPPTQTSTVRKSYPLPKFSLCPTDSNMVVHFDPARQNCVFMPFEGATSACQTSVDPTNAACLAFNLNNPVTLVSRSDVLTFRVGYNITTPTVANTYPNTFTLLVYEDGPSADADDYTFIQPGRLTIVQLQRTEFVPLSGSTRDDYTVITSNANFVLGSSDAPNTPTYPETLGVIVRLASRNVVVTKEINPLEWTVIVGSISAFWGLAGAVAVVFFVRKGDVVVPNWSSGSLGKMASGTALDNMT